MGASVGLALRRAGVLVQLEDADPAVLAEAAARGAGDPRAAEAAVPLVVVAVPPLAAGRVLAEQLVRWPMATVTDLTSVKAAPLREAVELGGDPTRLVGGHPMAGREVSGPGAARADLLDDRLWVVTPTSRTEPARLAAVRVLAEACGASRWCSTPRRTTARSR